MAHLSIERLKRPTETLSDAYLKNAHDGHIDWLKRHRGAQTLTDRGNAHKRRAAELMSTLSLRRSKRELLGMLKGDK